MLPDQQGTLKIVLMLTALLLSLSVFVCIWLYFEAFEDEIDRLTQLSNIHVHYLEAMNQLTPGWDEGAMPQEFFANRIQQVFDSLKDPHHFGKTGEVLLVPRHENGGQSFSGPPQSHSPLSQPLLLTGQSSFQFQLDLSGDSRAQIFPDSRGHMVLAAYQPLAGLPLGVIAKINIQEIQFPYFLGGGAIGLLEVGIMVVAGLILVRVKNAPGSTCLKSKKKIEEW